VLVPLVVVGWLAEIVFSLSVHHNGFLYYQGGDQIWYYTTGWLTGHGDIPKTLISPAWALLLAPFAAAIGPGYVSALPVAILIQSLVLAPIALYCVYDIASRIAGRLIGYVAAGLWVFGPYVAIPLFERSYHDKYVDQFLPHPLGLTMMGDFPSVVCLLAAGALILRAYQARSVDLAVAAGLVTGLAVLTKASNLIFLATPAVLFLVGRRWRELGVFAVALVPALGALALWKYRGYGTLPAFGNAMAEQRLALGSGSHPPGTVASILTPYHKYANIDWSHLQNNLDGLAEVFFSLRVLQFLPFAGAIAVARRSWRLALALSVWFWLYFVIKGSDSVSSVDSGSFFRLLLPAVPPLLVMVACLPVLVPRLGPALVERFPTPAPRIPGRRLLVAAAVLFGLVPLVASAALQRISRDRFLIFNQIAVPVDGGIGLRATVSGGTVRLSWNDASEGSTRVFYRVLRTPRRTDVLCRSSDGVENCFFGGGPLTTARATSASDRPRPGVWTYRIGVAANWVDDTRRGDVFLVSAPVTVRIR
jgi:hypothetical protein